MRRTRLLAIAAIELKRTLRDRPSLSLLLLLPAFQIVLFGFAIRIEPHDLPIALLGRSDQIEVVAQAIAHDPRLHVQRNAREHRPDMALRAGATLAVSIDPSGRVRIDADGADPVTARAALAIVQEHILQATAQAFPQGVPEIDLRWAFNPQQRSAWVLVPGLGGAIVMIAMLLLAAQSIVREREEGGWEALLLSQVGGLELLLGKMLPYLLLGVAQELVVLLLGATLFDIPIGSCALELLILVVPFAAAYLVWGLVLSLLARTPLQAMQGAMFLYLPSILLSGFLFPFAAMPRWARVIGEALPLTHFVRASRDLLLRGADGSAAWRALPALLLCAGAGLIVALILWRREKQ